MRATVTRPSKKFERRVVQVMWVRGSVFAIEHGPGVTDRDRLFAGLHLHEALLDVRVETWPLPDFDAAL
jgi:hypothetical protein